MFTDKHVFLFFEEGGRKHYLPMDWGGEITQGDDWVRLLWCRWHHPLLPWVLVYLFGRLPLLCTSPPRSHKHYGCWVCESRIRVMESDHWLLWQTVGLREAFLQIPPSQKPLGRKSSARFDHPLFHLAFLCVFSLDITKNKHGMEIMHLIPP